MLGHFDVFMSVKIFGSYYSLKFGSYIAIVSKVPTNVQAEAKNGVNEDKSKASSDKVAKDVVSPEEKAKDEKADDKKALFYHLLFRL